MKKYVAILLSIIIVSVGGIYINFNYKNNTDSKETSITLIPGALVYDGREYVEYYIISNPPSNLNELKELIKKYNTDNPILEVTKDGNKPSSYMREFLEATSHTPKDWKPKGHSDIIDDHCNDVIAKVSWKKDDEKNYMCFGKRNLLQLEMKNLTEKL